MPLALQEFLSLRQELPVIDVRSEGEFAAGHIPGANNVPLLNNEERTIVGTIYKTGGQRKAIHEGFRLVGPRLLEMVTAAEAITTGRDAIVHCWRGGMRSANFAQFIGMVGIRSHVLAGGYKTYRQAALEAFKKPLKLISITGCTGSGKSDVLRELARQGQQVVDLEAMAHHKGSAFGGLLQPPQPTTEQFQNILFEQLLTLHPGKPVWVEDESIAIGKIFLPPDFWGQLHTSPLVRMEVPKEVRVSRLVEEYGPADRGEFMTIMEKITKKLGGQNFNAAREKLLQGDMTSVIDILLTYYDKAYQRSMERRVSQLRFAAPWDGKNLEQFVSDLIQHNDRS
jgi:tRNA 2-selenouridine synthase